MIQLPPMQIAQGEAFAYDFTVTGQDWTGYTGTATFKRKPKAVTKGDWLDSQVEPILTVDVTADSAGLIQIGLTAEETATFPATPRLGFYQRAVCEVSMTDGTDVQKFQARVMVGAQI